MTERDKIPFINDINSLVDEFNFLYQNRLHSKQENKAKNSTRVALSQSDRKIIYEKTGGLCHICGCELNLNDFGADHVRAYSQKGSDNIDNFLPSCHPCNGYRWNYSPEEVQWIFKLGIWLRTRIQERENIGLIAGADFILDEVNRENRRKVPRLPKKSMTIEPENLFPIKGKHSKGLIEATHDEITKANKIITEFHANIDVGIENLFSNNSFVITGESNISRKELESLIITKGGIIKNTISQKVDFLVIGNFYGLSKVMKVGELNTVRKSKIRILTQAELIKYAYSKN